jgi:hypothetical protein
MAGAKKLPRKNGRNPPTALGVEKRWKEFALT